MGTLHHGSSHSHSSRRTFNTGPQRHKFCSFSLVVLVSPPYDESRWHICILLYRDLFNAKNHAVAR